jgi:hypothetical protein
MSTGACVADPVELSLLCFDGSDEAFQSVRDAVLHYARDLPSNDPIRDRLEIFLGNVQLGVFTVELGIPSENWAALMQKDWRPLAQAITRGYWLN